MTMRTASPYRSPCEILRKINDLCQSDDEISNKIRALCSEGQKKTKLLMKRYNDLEKEKFGNDWNTKSVRWGNLWGKNYSFDTDLDLRLKDDYLQEGSFGEIGKLTDEI